MFVKKKIIYSCKKNERCPHLEYQSCESVLAKVEYLIKRQEEMEKIMAEAEDSIRKQRKEIEEKNKKIIELEERIKQLEEGNNQKSFIKKKPEENPEDYIAPKRGAPLGHKGGTRVTPTEIHKHIHLFPKICPDCDNTDIIITTEVSQHIQEEIVIMKINVCYHHHHAYCPTCQKTFSAPAAEDEAHGPIGPLAKSIAGALHYGIGISIGKVRKIFSEIFGMDITEAGIYGFEKKIVEKGEKYYEEIRRRLINSQQIYADETGWYLDGRNYWLWFFGNSTLAYYHIDKSRGSKVVKEIIGEEYSGTLITDFYAAYNFLKAQAKQKCFPHLLRMIKEIEEKMTLCFSDKTFLTSLKEIIKQAIETHKEYKLEKIKKEQLNDFKENTLSQMANLVTSELENKEVNTLRKLLIRHQNELFTFLDNPSIDSSNNFSERQLRIMAILRSLSFGNRSLQGIKNHSVNSSLIKTTSLNGNNPVDLISALLTRKDHRQILEILFGNQQPNPP